MGSCRQLHLAWLLGLQPVQCFTDMLSHFLCTVATPLQVRSQVTDALEGNQSAVTGLRLSLLQGSTAMQSSLQLLLMALRRSPTLCKALPADLAQVRRILAMSLLVNCMELRICCLLC